MFIQENDEIRCASIHLMGNLSKFGSGEPVFKDQIHNVLVSLLLHLVDPNSQVVKVGNVHSDTKTLKTPFFFVLLGIIVGPSDEPLHHFLQIMIVFLCLSRPVSTQCVFVLLCWDQSRLRPCFRTTSMMTRACTMESSSMTSPNTW